MWWFRCVFHFSINMLLEFLGGNFKDINKDWNWLKDYLNPIKMYKYIKSNKKNKIKVKGNILCMIGIHKQFMYKETWDAKEIEIFTTCYCTKRKVVICKTAKTKKLLRKIVTLDYNKIKRMVYL